MSEIRRLTSDVWHQMSDLGRLTLDTRHRPSDVWQRTTNIRHHASDIRRLRSCIRPLTSHVLHQITDKRHQTCLKSDVRFSALWMGAYSNKYGKYKTFKGWIQVCGNIFLMNFFRHHHLKDLHYLISATIHSTYITSPLKLVPPPKYTTAAFKFRFFQVPGATPRNTFT